MTVRSGQLMPKSMFSIAPNRSVARKSSPSRRRSCHSATGRLRRPTTSESTPTATRIASPLGWSRASSTPSGVSVCWISASSKNAPSGTSASLLSR